MFLFRNPDKGKEINAFVLPSLSFFLPSFNQYFLRTYVLSTVLDTENIVIK